MTQFPTPRGFNQIGLRITVSAFICHTSSHLHPSRIARAIRGLLLIKIAMVNSGFKGLTLYPPLAITFVFFSYFALGH